MYVAAPLYYPTLSPEVTNHSWHIWLSCDTKLPAAPNTFQEGAEIALTFTCRRAHLVTTKCHV
jgi:hypothetical protein